jgi:hypothetical protein
MSKIKGRCFFLWIGIRSRLQNRAYRLLFPHTSNIYQYADANVEYVEYVKPCRLSEGVAPERIFLAPRAIDDTEYNRQAEEKTRPALLVRLGIFEEQEVILNIGRVKKRPCLYARGV